MIATFLLAALASPLPEMPASQTSPLQAPPSRTSASTKPDGNRLVKVSLLADREAIRPSDTITLAVELAIEPKWHIYWQNPGDAGVPTKIEVRAPEGFEVGAVRYPVPQREETDGLYSYVHTGTATFLVDMKAPANLANAPRVSSTTSSSASATPPSSSAIEVGVSCRWLVCTDICLQGKGEATIALPIAASSDAPRLANEKAIAAARAKLPLAFDELYAIEGFHFTDFTDWKKPFAIVVPGALALDFYPYVEDPLTLNVSTVQADATNLGARMKIQFEPPAGYEGPRFGFSGVLAVRTAHDRACYEVRCGYGAPATPASSSSPSGNTKSPLKR